MYSISDIAAELGVTSTRVRQLYRDAGIQPTEINGRHLISDEQRKQLLAVRDEKAKD